jgi:acyl-CoA thioesterase FadM
MKIFYEGRVDPTDIDNLGHMNMRVYGRKSATATHGLADHLGLDDRRLASLGAIVQNHDNHTRFYREQLEGAALVVKGGVVSATPDLITAYFELSNATNGDLAATFINSFRLADAKTRAPSRMDDSVVQAALDCIVDWPDHGRPRSVDLDPVRTDITLSDMGDQQVMVHLEPYEVLAEDCDEHGYMDISDGTSLAFAKLPIKFERRKSDKGEHRGWGDDRVAMATMESRQYLIENPQLGETIVTRSTHLDVGRKTLHSVHWTFSQDTGRPLMMVGQIGLGFDLVARKSMEFPPKMREMLELNLHKEFA